MSSISQKGGHSSRSPFKLYDSDKENQTMNTHKKPRVSTERSVISKFDSARDESSVNSLYAGRLQAKLKEVSLALAQRTKQLRDVTEERNCLKLICSKQSTKLSQSNTNSEIEILKEDYRLQLDELRAQRERIGQILSQINSDHSRELEALGSELQQAQNSRSSLEKKCEQLTEENGRLQQQADTLRQNLMEKDGQLQRMKEELFERRNIEKKYRLALRELERLDKQGHQLNF